MGFMKTANTYSLMAIGVVASVFLFWPNQQSLFAASPDADQVVFVQNQSAEDAGNNETEARGENRKGGMFAGVKLPEVVSTVVYVLLGLVLFVVCYRLFELMTPFSLAKELVEDENAALGTLMAGVAIGLSIIVAAAIV